MELTQQRALPHLVVEDEHNQEEKTEAVEKVLGYRDVFNSKRRSERLRREFLVKYEGREPSDNSWVDSERVLISALRLQLVREMARGTILAQPVVYRVR